jgi:prephenate dehydrogenase
MKIGILGYGRLGKLICKYLGQDATLVVFDNDPKKQDDIKKDGHQLATLEQVGRCPIIIPFVPISELENALTSIKSFLNAGTLIIDVCSVKIRPVETMLKVLPENIHILGTHPMFGPDSAKHTLFGAKIVLSKVRMPDDLYINIKNYLESHGLKVIEASPDEHDKQISRTLVLTHLIGRTLIDFKAKPHLIDTKGYRRLMKILDQVENDTWQLFEDMNSHNPYAKEVREEFKSSLEQIIKKLS